MIEQKNRYNNKRHIGIKKHIGIKNGDWYEKNGDLYEKKDILILGKKCTYLIKRMRARRKFA